MKKLKNETHLKIRLIKNNIPDKNKVRKILEVASWDSDWDSTNNIENYFEKTNNNPFATEQ